jgi:diguanylate cyclase (GGDEF)-like protein/PAS domain S-box-containing protein
MPARGGSRFTLDGVLIVTAAVLWSASVAWLVSGIGAAATRLAVADLAEPALDLVAVLIVLRVARGPDVGRVRLGWAFICLALLVYAAGDGLYAWFDLVAGGASSPSLADVAYVAYYPIIGAALLLFPSVASDPRERLRLTLDSSIVVVGGGIVLWQTLLGPALATLTPNPLGAALSLGYPIGDLVLLFGMAAMALRRPVGIDPRALVALVGGLLLMFVADVGYGGLTLAGTFDVQRWPDVGYLSSSLLMALAGYLQTHPARTRATPESAVLGRWLLALPYAGLAAGYGTVIALVLAQGGVSGDLREVLFGALVLTLLVFLRQELVLRENSSLLAEQVRRESETRFDALTAHTTDAIVLVDSKGTIVQAAPVVGRVLGVDAARLVGQSIAGLAHADDMDRVRTLVADVVAGRPVARPVEWRLWDATGHWRQVETIAADLREDPSVGQIVLTTRDVGARKTLEQQLTQVTLHDLLTNLPNRALFHDRLGQALASGERAGRPTTVLFLGLDGFRRVNESHGHAAGDRLLEECARRLQASVRAADTCARLGGDEFGVLLDGDPSAQDRSVVAERILAAIRQPMSVGQEPLQLTASLGMATNLQLGADAISLLRNAQLARSAARDAGGDRMVTFEPAMQHAAQSQLELETELRGAVAQGQLVLLYQPIVDLKTGELAGAEALVRWDHPTRGRLGPGLFIPLAEEIGLIDEIGTWVLRTACVEVAHWAGLARGPVPRVSINLSVRQVADPQLPWTVQAAMAQAGAAPNWITLELTESLLLQNTAAVLERLHALRALGVAIAIDDFGTGYSSLAYLQEFPVTHIKIDRSFVTPLDDPTRGSGVVHAIIEIARALGMTTVAEGIETPTQLERLRELGCPLAQGFLFAPPLEAAAMAELVARPVGPIWSVTSGSRRGSQSRRRLLDVVVRPTVPRGSTAAVGPSLKRPPRLQRRTRGGQPQREPSSRTRPG